MKTLLLAMVALVVALSLSSTQSRAATLTSDQPSGSYFGVDPNDSEAVREKQKELSHENFKRIFGDEVDANELDFSDLNEADSNQVQQHLRNTLKWVFEKVFRSGESSG